MYSGPVWLVMASNAPNILTNILCEYPTLHLVLRGLGHDEHIKPLASEHNEYIMFDLGTEQAASQLTKCCAFVFLKTLWIQC
jgi:hypothetical protein